MANRVRKNKITFFVDDDERAVIKLKMAKMNMSNLSLYLRKMALEGRIIKVDGVEYKILSIKDALAIVE